MKKFAWVLVAVGLLAGCGAAPAGLSSADRAGNGFQRASKVEAKNPFAALEITSVDDQLMLCPCFTLKAKAGSNTVMVDFEGDSAPVTINQVMVNGAEADETQLAALRTALEKAAGKMKNKQHAALAKLVAKAI